MADNIYYEAGKVLEAAQKTAVKVGRVWAVFRKGDCLDLRG